MNIIGLLLSAFGIVRRALGWIIKILSRPIRVPLAVVVVPVVALSVLWWRADNRADNLGKKLSAAQSDLTNARGTIKELNAALADCQSNVSEFKAEADAANRRAQDAAKRADESERAARRKADRIMMTQTPPAGSDGPSISECKAAYQMLRRELLR